MTDQLPLGSKLAHNIGLIVLASQDLERHLKVVLAASESTEMGSVIDHHKKLERRALGEVVARFLGNVTVTEGSASDLEGYFSRLLDRRNKVVHHFFETYGEDLTTGRHKDVLANLAALCAELREVARSFKSVNEAMLESLQQEPPLAS
jgi:hypothetical protein